MSVGVLLVTHGKLGHHLLETLREMVGELPLSSDVLEVRRVQAIDALLRQGQRMLARLDVGDGALLLTDAYGATPGNIAAELAQAPGRRLVAGVNLPMLIRIYNEATLALGDLANAAAEAGQRGISVSAPVGAELPRARLSPDAAQECRARSVEIVNRLGLHARAATKLVTLAAQFRSEITLAKDAKTVSGKSILAVMTLAAAQGSRVTISATGSDAGAAIDALTALIARRFDEAS